MLKADFIAKPCYEDYVDSDSLAREIARNYLNTL